MYVLDPLPHKSEERLQDSLQATAQQKLQVHLAQTWQLAAQPAARHDVQAGVQAAEGPAATADQLQPASATDQPSKQKTKKKRRHTTADEPQEGPGSAAVPLQQESKKRKKHAAQMVLEQQRQQSAEEDAKEAQLCQVLLKKSWKQLQKHERHNICWCIGVKSATQQIFWLDDD